MSVTEFPIYNLYNIPEALRKVANEIEANPASARHIVLVLQNEDGGCNYRAFGKDFSRAHATGLLVYGQALIMGVKVD